jgi:hypothetical protein
MKRILFPVLALVIAFAACDDPTMMEPPPNNGGPHVDLSSFTGCWHVTSGTTAFGSGDCRAALDSVLRILKIEGVDSVFAAIDTVTHLSLVPPYYGTGDFSGTDIGGRLGSVQAVYHHLAGTCSLTTTISGGIDAGNGTEDFSAFYTVEIQFSGGDSCSAAGECMGTVLFECTRRPLERCGIP